MLLFLVRPIRSWVSCSPLCLRTRSYQRRCTRCRGGWPTASSNPLPCSGPWGRSRRDLDPPHRLVQTGDTVASGRVLRSVRINPTYLGSWQKLIYYSWKEYSPRGCIRIDLNESHILLIISSLLFCLCFQDSEFSVSKTPVDESSSRPSSLCPSKSDPPAEENSTKTLAGVLAALPAPPGGVKRKHSGDDPSAIFNPPSKVHRPGRRDSRPSI